MKRRAFTLLEILIVIAIIALLAAILFPVFGRVRALGRRTTCASNLKQISLALQQYVQDYKFYPKMLKGGVTGGSLGSFSAVTDACNLWPDKVMPYVKQESLFVCPDDPDHLYRPGCPPDDKSDPNHPISFLGSYSLNAPYSQVLFDFANIKVNYSYDSRVGTSPMRYTRPSSTILLCDGINFSAGSGAQFNVGGFIAPGYTQPPPTDAASLANYGVPDRHEGGVNAAFADGHVKWMSLDSLLKLSLWKINGPE